MFENYLKVWNIFLEDSALLFCLAVEEACLSRHQISAVNVANFYHLVMYTENAQIRRKAKCQELCSN